ncbi:MAG TPA: STY0301 family protein [Candidatus Binataceae bacterium]
MKRITLSLIAFACAIAAPHLACAQATCPPELAVEQKVSAPGSDWTVAYSRDKTAVAGVTIFEGLPAEQASLVPDSEKKTHDTVIQTWKLPKSDRGYWLQCQYVNTTAQIYRRLPANVMRCDVSYERNVSYGGGGLVVKSVNCK